MENYSSKNRWIFTTDDLGDVEDSAEKTIRSYSDIGNYEQPPANEDTVNRALLIYALGKSYGLSVESFLVGDGDIEISFSYIDHFVDVLILRNGTYNLYCEVGIGESFNREETLLNVTRLESKIELKLWRIWINVPY